MGALAMLAAALAFATSAAANPRWCQRALVGATAALSRTPSVAATGTARVVRACCGPDRKCGTGDEVPLAALGWATTMCPDMGCPAPVTDASGIVACAACVARATASSLDSVLGGEAVARRCQSALRRAARRYRVSRAKAFARCRRPSDPDCSAPPVDTTEAALGSRACRACGGRDGRCGGSDDVAPEAAGFPPVCPAAPCTRSLVAISDAVACVACLAARAVDCVGRLAVPDFAAYPAECTTPSPGCQPGIQCATSGECPAGYTCRDNGVPATRYCVGPECTADADCAGSGVCRQHCIREGFSVICGSRRCQCPGFGCTGPDELCFDAGTLACRKLCLQDSDCLGPFGFVCVNAGAFSFGTCIGTKPCQ